MSQETPTREAFDFTIDALSPELPQSSKSSYSLLLLFYLTTVAAVLTAVCRLAFVDTAWSTKAILIGYIIVGGVCVLMSAVTGYLIGRTWVSTLLGLLAGSLCGVVALLMTLIQPKHYENAGMILSVGCWLLSIIAIVSNRWQSNKQ